MSDGYGDGYDRGYAEGVQDGERRVWERMCQFCHDRVDGYPDGYHCWRHPDQTYQFESCPLAGEKARE